MNRNAFSVVEALTLSLGVVWHAHLSNQIIAFLSRFRTLSGMTRKIVWLRDFTCRGFKTPDSAATTPGPASSGPASTVRLIVMTHRFKKGDTHDALVGAHQFLVDGIDVSDQAKEGKDFTFLD